jgi:Spy/CpxP family protein refolding chaperone
MSARALQRLFVLTIAAAILAAWAIPVFSAADKPQPPERAKDLTVGRMAELTKKLNLTEEQQAKIKPILENELQQTKSLREDKATPPQQRREKMQTIRTSTNDEINKVLTPEQQKKFAEMNPPSRLEHRSRADNRINELGEKLDLTADQKAKLQPILDTEAKEIQAARDDKALSPEQRMTKIAEIRKTTQESINGILTPEQQKKFAEMKTEMREERHEQMRERMKDRMGELSEKLNLTDEQKAKIKPIVDKEAADIKAVGEDKALTMEQKQAKITEIHTAGHEEINKILTPEQQKKFAEMKSQAEEKRNLWQHKPAAKPEAKPAETNK